MNECLLCHTVNQIMWFPINYVNDIKWNLKLGAIILREAQKAQQCEIKKLCAFSMHIGHNRACATILKKNEFNKKVQDFWKNTAETTVAVWVLPGIYGTMKGGLSISWFEFLFTWQFLCFDSCFQRLWTNLVFWGIATSFSRNLPYFESNWRFITHRFLKVLCFSCKLFVRELHYW